MKGDGSATSVLLVGGDLIARSRLEAAATGATVATTTPERLLQTLREIRADVVVIDLDSGRHAVLSDLESARQEGLLPPRVVAYFSHVDADLRDAARRAGCDALPRGRFWRELSAVLAGRTEES